MNNNSSFYYILTALWLIAAVGAGHFGLLGRVRPPLIVPVLVLLLVVASFTVPSFRSWLCSISLNSLVAIHLTRFVGFYFLYLYGLGRLPYEFAVYGGWGDIAVAALALILLILSAEGVIKSYKYYFAWNIIGLIDILFVVLTAARLVAADPGSMSELTHLPLSLLPTFLVPIIIFTHLVIGYRLYKKRLPVV